MIGRLRHQELQYRWQRFTAALLEFTVRALSFSLADQIALRLSYTDRYELYDEDEQWSD